MPYFWPNKIESCKTHFFFSLSPLLFSNYYGAITYFLCVSSSPWATGMTVSGIAWVGGVSGAIQTAAQILRCRPHVEERGLQALPTRRTLPQHNASFHSSSSRGVTQTCHEAEPEVYTSTHTRTHTPYFINSDSKKRLMQHKKQHLEPQTSSR